MATIDTTVAAYGASMGRERRAPKGIERYMCNLRHLTAWGGQRDVREIKSQTSRTSRRTGGSCSRPSTAESRQTPP
jgi:hypothetical protein